MTINDAGYYNSDENDAEGNATSHLKIATHNSDRKKIKVTDTDTRNINLQQKLLINRTLLIITIPMDPRIENKVATYRASTVKIATPRTTKVITDTAHINVRAIWTPGFVCRTGRDVSTPGHCDVDVGSPWLNYPVLIGTTVYPNRTGSQEIFSPPRSTSSVKVGNSQVFNTSINGNLTRDGDSKPIFSKVIRRELSYNSSADISSSCRVNFISNAIGTKILDFMHLGLTAVNASDELRSVGTPTTRVGRHMDS